MLDKRAFHQNRLEQKVAIQSEMSVEELNKALNLWLRIKLVNLYAYLSDLLHTKVRYHLMV